MLRLEDTLTLNSKLDHHIKNKDEKIKELESLLQTEEDRYCVISNFSCMGLSVTTCEFQQEAENITSICITMLAYCV